MTVHCLLVGPPRPGLSLPGLAGGPLTESGAAKLYAASVADAMVAAEGSGGDLLVNYPAEAQLPESHRTGDSPEDELRELAEDTLEEPEAARFEVQVGSTVAARAGNAAGHLLSEDDVSTVAVLPATAPTLGRTALDGAAMRLRRVPVVLAPGTGGRAPYLGLGEPIDFEGAYSAPEVSDLARRGREAGHEVEFLAHHPVIETEPGLAAVVAEVEARQRADRPVPDHTARAIGELGLEVAVVDGRRRVRSGE